MSRKRPNGTGTAFQRKGETVWTCQVVVGWKLPSDPSKPKRPIYRRKGGFKSKRDALNYCSTLMSSTPTAVHARPTLDQVWREWKAFYSPRVDASTMACYISAYGHFQTLHDAFMDVISPDDLQACMDACKAGKRTHQNMRTTAGLLWRYAVDKKIVDRDITGNLYTGPGRSVKREPITPAEEKTIYTAIGRIRYAEYVYCLCNLGYRPGEFLSLKKEDLHCANIGDADNPEWVWYFIHGVKTEAGRNRTVVIPSAILPIVLSRLYVPGTDLIFPMYQFDRKGEKLLRLKLMTDAYFRESVFKPMMASLRIAEGKVPYGARHTYSNKLKAVQGADADKAELIGHATYEFTKSAYQSSSLPELKALVDQFK